MCVFRWSSTNRITEAKEKTWNRENMGRGMKEIIVREDEMQKIRSN